MERKSIQTLEEKLEFAGTLLSEHIKDENLWQQIIDAIREFYINKKAYVTVTIRWHILRKLRLHWEGLTSYLKMIVDTIFGYDKITVHRNRKVFILIFSQ